MRIPKPAPKKAAKRTESPPPKTTTKVEHLAGQKLRAGNKAERSLAGSVERHIEPRRPATKKKPPKKP